MNTLTIAAGAALLVMAGVCQADPLAGRLGLGEGTVAVSTAGTDFSPAGVGGTFTVGGASTGTFAALKGISGVIKDLSALAQPVGTPILLADFVSLASAPDVHFNATLVSPGAFGSSQCFAPAAVGQTCSPPGSPLQLVNTPTGVAASYSVSGTVTAPGVAPATFNATFSTQFAGTTIQTLLSTIGVGGIAMAPYAGNVTVPTGVLAGSISIGSTLRLGASAIDFAPLGGTSGQASIAGTSTGSFAVLANTDASIRDLATIGAIGNFIQPLVTPNQSLSLDALATGIFSSAQCGSAPVPGQVCSLPGGPYSFYNLAGGSVMLLSLTGRSLDASTLAQDSYGGLLLADFGTSYQMVLASLLSGGTVDAAWSAELLTAMAPAAPVDEPAIAWLMLLPLIGATVARRKLKRTAEQGTS